MIPDPYADRGAYRVLQEAGDLTYYRISVDETDLSIGTRGQWRREALEAVLEARRQVLAAIGDRPRFRTSLEPLRPHGTETPLIREMLEAGLLASVGPMAAVAGAVAAFVGFRLAARSPEVVVENGGDVFLFGKKTRSVAVVAGESPLSGLLSLRVRPGDGLGLCTSSGTVGHSLSFGKADAAMVMAKSCALADAAATRLGNLVQDPEKLDAPLDEICAIPGVEGALVIMGDRLGVLGNMELEVTGKAARNPGSPPPLPGI